MADVEIAVWLGRKAGSDAALPFAGLYVVGNDLADKIKFCCGIII